MIKDFVPQPYNGLNPLPSYATKVRAYTLTAKAPSNYVITLAKLTVGESLSAGKPLAHALFESFTDHGERAKAARTRASGCDLEFTAVRGAMSEAGVEFCPALPCPYEEILEAFGEWFMAQNPELTEASVVSQQL